MITTTLQKERQRKGRSYLLKLIMPLVAFIASMGPWQAVKAQTVQFYDDAINLTVQQTGGSVQPVGYTGKLRGTDAPYASYTRLGNTATGTTVPTIGTFDVVNTSQLTLSGGSIVLKPLDDSNGDPFTVTGARVQYRVYLRTATTLPNYTALSFPTSAAVSSPAGSTRYSGTGSANLLSGIVLGGQYVLELRFEASTSSPIDGVTTDADPSAATYQAYFNVTAPPAPTLQGKAVYITPNSGPNAGTQLTYNVNSSTLPAFSGANLGSTTYDINTGQLTLNGGLAVTTEAGSSTVTNATLYYRVRQQGTGGGAFSFINLPQTSTTTSGNRTFSTNTSTINLISAATVTGSYSVDIYFQASGTNGTSNFTLVDDNSGSYYTASFNVNGTPIPSTVWTGGLNDNWFDSANWTNGIPTAGTNVTIANLGTGSNNPYPRILCNTSYIYTSGNQQSTVNNNTSGVALARNLTMAGNSQADRSILSLVIGTLRVSGDFDNRYDSFVASDGTITAFVGSNQTISGGTFSSVEIDGGGNKSVQTIMNVVSDIIFDNGYLVTDITQPTVSVVVLSDRAAINSNNGGRLMGEKDASYLRGFVRITHRTSAVGTEDTYGNLGLGLTFTSVNPGEITLTRNTAQAYNPGNGAASGIRRIFEVTQPTTNAGTTVAANMRFFYLDNETQSLGSNGTINIDENNLGVFVTTNKGNTFTALGSNSVDTNADIVTLNNVTAFAVPTTTFTLGDKTNPLPVELVAFDAKRSGSNALITWETASERNSSGFEVQVSTDGVTFRKLTFVASASANSTTTQAYSYTDTETGKSGVRYYRLRQVDIDGQYAYSPTRAVSFASATSDAVAALSAYPSPFTTGDQAALVLQAPTAGTAQLQLMDIAGRTLVSSEVATIAGVSETPVPNANNLAAGIYMVKVTFATGEVKTLRIQKK